MATNTLDLDEEQVLAFCARRGQLLGPGAKDVRRFLLGLGKLRFA